MMSQNTVVGVSYMYHSAAHFQAQPHTAGRPATRASPEPQSAFRCAHQADILLFRSSNVILQIVVEEARKGAFLLRCKNLYHVAKASQGRSHLVPRFKIRRPSRPRT